MEGQRAALSPSFQSQKSASNFALELPERHEPDLIVFSHLRWDFVLQRPQHLISRFAKHHRVFFFEEPVPCEGFCPFYEIHYRDPGVYVVVPRVPQSLPSDQIPIALSTLVDDLISDQDLLDFVSWYYTPMALNFTRHLKPRAVVFDVMDELSAFKDAPQDLIHLEEELLRRSDVVFTGGVSLYEAKKNRHASVYPFPSSIDREHFQLARGLLPDPVDQAPITGPRLGFFGVIDERMDLDLIDQISFLRPEWQFVFLGPVVKIDSHSLPRRGNLHYLGKKNYSELPNYLAGWDVALLPFARNESTRFISPTKTPEYLAAGRPVVSTSIRDVVRPYGDLELVHIADSAEDFVKACERAMSETRYCSRWRGRVEEFLSTTSWDSTFQQMAQLMRNCYEARSSRRASEKSSTVVSPSWEIS
ncbi:MAG: glycosyltransferase family 1 protein [Bdellovibrionales bacterium]